jgi:NADPH:quinone reductase-like Zn-dependent oxidoreductase
VRALVADGAGGAVLKEVPEPSAGPGDAIVEVHATSLNRGELNRLKAAAQGWRPGWDFAGVVVQAAGGGPAVGARVVGVVEGQAWAERVAVPAGRLAELDDGLAFTTAAALPTAGLTALRMLRFPPGTLGRRVVVTGAAGGVGRFAVQLAHAGGAHVSAVVGRPERARGLAELGADAVVTDLSQLQPPLELILDGVGGESLARLATMLDLDGTLVVFGNSSNQPTTFRDVRDFYLGGYRRLQAFTVFHGFQTDPPGRDLGQLAGMVSRGRLQVEVDSLMSWTEMGEALRRLAERSVMGKIVLVLR